MKDFVISLSKKQQAKVQASTDDAVMVIGYYWGAGAMRLFPVPDKQAHEFQKLLQRYKEECQGKDPGYETEAWNTLHNNQTQGEQHGTEKRHSA